VLTRTSSPSVIAPAPTRTVASSSIAAMPQAMIVTRTTPMVLRKRSDLTVRRSTSASEPS